jgi:hypothetical protein
MSQLRLHGFVAKGISVRIGLGGRLDLFVTAATFLLCNNRLEILLSFYSGRYFGGAGVLSLSRGPE